MEQVANQQAYPYNLFPEADQLSLTYSSRYSPKGPKPLLRPVSFMTIDKSNKGSLIVTRKSLTWRHVAFDTSGLFWKIPVRLDT